MKKELNEELIRDGWYVNQYISQNNYKDGYLCNKQKHLWIAYGQSWLNREDEVINKIESLDPFLRALISTTSNDCMRSCQCWTKTIMPKMQYQHFATPYWNLHHLYYGNNTSKDGIFVHLDRPNHILFHLMTYKTDYDYGKAIDTTMNGLEYIFLSLNYIGELKGYEEWNKNQNPMYKNEFLPINVFFTNSNIKKMVIDRCTEIWKNMPTYQSHYNQSNLFKRMRPIDGQIGICIRLELEKYFKERICS